MTTITGTGKMKARDRKALLKLVIGSKILPGDQIPANAKYHICSPQPVPNAANYEAMCYKCGRPVYFSDAGRERLLKLCYDCLLKISRQGPVECYGCQNSLAKAWLSRKAN